jgi:hypothetical protein
MGTAAPALFVLLMSPAAHAYGRGWHPVPPGPRAYGYAPTVVRPAWPEMPQLGLDLTGVVQSPSSRQPALAGIGVGLQLRTSSHSLLSLEIQSLDGDRGAGVRRDEVDGLLAGRVFLWNAALAPFVELGAGVGRASIQGRGYEATASQLLGRIGLGLEVRLGRHLVLEGELAQVHRLHLGDEPAQFGDLCCEAPQDRHERATEVRGGLAVRF